MERSETLSKDFIREKEVSDSDKKLGKKLSTLDLFFIAFSGMVGSGWLYGSAASAFYAGPASILSWPIAGAIVFFILFTWAEVGTSLPKSGGLVRFSSYTHGPFTTFSMGITYTMASIVVPTLEAEAIVGYLSAYIPGMYHGIVLSPSGIAIAAALVFVMFLVNYLGINLLRRVNTGISFWKIAVPILTFILLLLLEFHGGNFGLSNLSNSRIGFAPYGWGMVLYAIPAGGVIFALEGFRQPLEYAGEAKSSKKLLLASVSALLVVILLYTLLETSFVGSINWSLVGVSPGNWAGLEGTTYYTNPFYYAMKVSGIPLLVAFAYFLLIDAWVSPFGTGLVYFGNSVRDIFGLGGDNLLPNSTIKLNKYKVPLWGGIITLIVSLFFLLPFPSWYALIGYASVVGVLNYLMGGAMLFPLRKYLPNLKRVFKLPYAGIIAPIGFIGSILIVYWSGLSTLWAVMTTFFLALPVMYFTYVPSTELIPNKSISYFIGIIMFIIGLIMTIFSYFWFISPPSGQSLFTTELLFLTYYIIMLVSILVLLYLTQRFSSHTIEDNKYKVKSFLWVIILLFGLLLISFFGAFGMNVIIFPWDTIIAIIISIPVYFLAVRSGYETEQLKALKGELDFKE